ncbi:acyl transferase domain-containing protein [Flammula alnicola]|nr:acyl transferase domain-containing protein [Flammula alnicola]
MDRPQSQSRPVKETTHEVKVLRDMTDEVEVKGEMTDVKSRSGVRQIREALEGLVHDVPFVSLASALCPVYLFRGFINGRHGLVIGTYAIFIFQYAVSTWLESLGVHSHAVMGHSLGEIAAAVIARAFTFKVGLQFVVERAKLLQADPAHPAGMVAIQASEERISRYIQNLGLADRLVIAAYNGPEAHVVSGEMKAVESLMTAAKRDGLISKQSLSRLVPSLESLEQGPPRSPSGTTVIVGMGSIGQALAVSLVECSCSASAED